MGSFLINEREENGRLERDIFVFVNFVYDEWGVYEICCFQVIYRIYGVMKDCLM